MGKEFVIALMVGTENIATPNLVENGNYVNIQVKNLLKRNVYKEKRRKILR